MGTQITLSNEYITALAVMSDRPFDKDALRETIEDLIEESLIAANGGLGEIVTGVYKESSSLSSFSSFRIAEIKEMNEWGK